MKITSLLFRIFPLLIGGLFVLNTNVVGQKIELKDFGSSFTSSNGHAHSEKCAHTVLEAQLEKELGVFGSKDFFEDWMNRKIEAQKSRPQIARILEGPRKIPVVVHVIHNGSAVGVGPNIPDSQIFEQIRILNEDFRRLNADADRTPAEFLPVAADANIEFVLAKQDPNGLPTTGIVRLQGTKTTYTPDDATLIGQLSQWNPEEYLNLWVVPLVSPFIGYASFPISDLPGLNFSPFPAIADGVTIDYRFLGIGGSATSASRGRTATHEVGHYLGLRHIWGDGGCGVDDFVTDTPDQDNSNNICNANPSRFSCGTNNMIQNYMDYTPDPCMNLFTKGQVERFDVVLANSPRRVTLVNNRATKEPVLPDRDLSLTRILQPADAICDLTITPEVEILNSGNITITSARIEFRRNGQLVESRRFNLNLQTGQSQNVAFSTITTSGEANQFQFTVVEVNDDTDLKPENNTRTSTPVLQGQIALPYNLNLSNFPAQWVISNPDQSLTWERTNITVDGVSQPAVYIRHYEYEAPGQLDYFISPQIDLTQNPNAQLVFELAHGPYNQNGFQDEVIVTVAPDCSFDFDLINAAYQKSGTRLQTSEPTLDEFIPTSSSQFRTELVNLSKYKDLGKVRVAIISKNSYGNNIYLRNIRILPTEEFKYELKVDRIITPSPISSGNHQEEVVRVSNTGNLTVSRFLFTRNTNNSGNRVFVASGANIRPGETVDLSINNSTSDGKNNLSFGVSEPNFDQNFPAAPLFRRFNIENPSVTEVPWRQNFNSSSDLNPWLTINPEADQTAWQVIPVTSGTGTNNVARLQSGVNGNSYWLGTPVFDLSVSRQASVFFDVAAGAVNPSTTLRLLASVNGGEEYSVIWSATGSELSTVNTGEANPNSAGDYERKYVNLTEFAGQGKNLVRLAFELNVVGTQNSPVYLDNLELFLSANPDPVIPAEGNTILFPNPAVDYFNIAFNLPRRESVTLQIISSTGALVQELVFPNTLNQTYTFTREMFSPGLYIIKITSPTLQEIKRLVIN
ncbi:M43 family zinc metalloprotease [Algoriphagus sp. AK58]|uniref:M43 family zinc metalloprotease n=1 Tax=Algoriphagus sp. AK58 TaxID=1406877 RepID=UPI001650C620|nr:M43 family zinc metalloprotease [Algoriphagus sp. AK58]MBC6365241.1 Pregnancy-associated plasma protein-A [Algoriphagus sp. AK58]